MPGASYAWIAVGSALGGVARAWVALVVARFTGPAFPWGTILINVAGSFIIGFVAAASVSTGRWPLPADIRAFIMVGFCGGFTTFSSFSLQTLELARDGRGFQALANVALSVAICLLAVTAGFYGAAALSPAKRFGLASRADVPPAVALVNAAGEGAALEQAAARLATLTGTRAEIIRLAAPPPGTILPSEEVLTLEREIQEAIRIIETTVSTGATIVARPDMVDQLVLASGNPVLVIPPGTAAMFGRIVAIAWKEHLHAVRAITASLPILRQAERVYLLHVRARSKAPEQLPPILREHGIEAEMQLLPASDKPVGARVLTHARAINADLIVMGAYGRGEWRETLLGGVTRYMLRHADIPLLMRH